MGILDDAIRDHLDLKRKHGARDAELREIEDDAFGSGDRPDPFAAGELFGGTAAPEAAEPGSPPGGIGSEEPTRLVEPEAAAPAAAPESPAPPEPAAPAEPAFPEPAFPEPGGEEPEALEPLPETDLFEDAAVSGPETPAPEPEASEPPPPAPEPAVTEPPARAPEAEESESLAELMAEEESEPSPSADVEVPPPPPPDAGAARPGGEPAAPLAAEAEPAVPEPPPPPPEPGTEPPGRARGRVHHPTEEHPAPEPGSLDFPAVEPQGEEAEAGIFDFETDEGELPPGPAPAGESDEFEELGPPSDEATYLADEEPYTDEQARYDDTAVEAPEEEPPLEDDVPASQAREDEDLLAESPDFIEEETGEEDLWFEKGPPQDFDFEDER